MIVFVVLVLANFCHLKSKIYQYIIPLIFFLIPFQGNSQIILQKKQFQFAPVIKVDSLSLVPGSVQIYLNNSSVDAAFYKIDYLNSKIEFDSAYFNQNDEISIAYRYFPINFKQRYFHKNQEMYMDSMPFLNPEYTYRYKPAAKTELFGLEGFEKSGNITRGVSVGNSQNLSVTSDMNLQLSGKITPDMQLTASITDNNIPIQPDGNTQQLQDFDRVYMRLDHKNFSVIAGDFSMSQSSSEFLNYSKKMQGASVHTNFELNNKGILTAYGGAAIARGNYHRFKFSGVEGVQGPYKLQGASFERYIVVLSGTERVYMDGKLLTRGETEDYIIDYNTAEITFSPKIIVTKDKRFEVEFEYSEQNYSRAAISSGLAYKTDKTQIRFDMFSEGDMKNQPIEPLDDNAKNIMASVGDNIDLALIPSVDSMAFSEDRIMYKMIDSLGFDSVFIYSTNPDSAFYQLSFSLVGSGKGDYNAVNTAANGRVFKWVAPINGVKQGEYSPLKLLVTPKKNQVFSTSVSYSLSQHVKFYSDIAVSVNDINTFSGADSKDNTGYAAKFAIIDTRNLSTKKDGWKLISDFSYQKLNRDFKPIERIRTIEFDRQWSGLSAIPDLDQQMASANISLQKKQNGRFKTGFDKMFLDESHQGFKSDAELYLSLKKWIFSGNALLSKTIQQTDDYSFLSHRLEISRNFNWFLVGASEFSEKNSIQNDSSQILKPSSFYFQQYATFIQAPDTNKLKYRIDFIVRRDYRADLQQFVNQTYAKDIKGQISWKPRSNQRLNLLISWRDLQISDTTLSINPESNSQTRIDYQIVAWKGLVRFNTFYESTSGLELKKEYSYIQVASGQGVYSWVDYNGNGVKELDEFEIAAFQDQANYIRILLPSTEYVKTYGSRYSLVLAFQPSYKWQKSEKNALKFISHFSDNMVFNSQIKTKSDQLSIQLNPVVYNLFDTSLVYLNSFFRNSVYINKNNPVFGMEWNYYHNLNKMLMLNGYEGRSLEKHEIKFRVNISKIMMLEIEDAFGLKSAYSEFFDSRDFTIDFEKVSSKFTFQPDRKYRISVNYSYGEKTNNVGIQNAFSNDISLAVKVSSPEKGTISGLISAIQWKYNADELNSLGFEMLEGYRTGTNYRWNLSYNRTLMDNLQLTVIFDGRLPSGYKAIHTGTVQLRAYF